jgi:hypothetical protein
MLIDSQSRQYEKPESGLYDAVFADYVDLGNVTTTFKGQTKTQHMIRLFWLITAKDSEGNNFEVVKRVAASMFEKSNLFKVVKGMLGQPPVLSGPKGSFELEDLIGRNNQLVVNKETKPDGKIYANIEAFLPAKLSFQIPSTYVRRKDRPATPVNNTQATQATTSATKAVAVVEEEEEQIPF